MRSEVTDDRDLYWRFVEGDLDAFESLFRRYEREVYGWTYRIVRRRAEAEELTVETFWQIYRARARFSPARGFGPWARRIATNLALNRLRTLGRYEPLPVEPAAPAPADAGERGDLRRAIAEAFAALSPKLRLVAVLAFVEQVPYGEIAEALGLSLEAVKSRVFRASRKLRRLLEAKGIRRIGP